MQCLYLPLLAGFALRTLWSLVSILIISNPIVIQEKSSASFGTGFKVAKNIGPHLYEMTTQESFFHHLLFNFL